MCSRSSSKVIKNRPSNAYFRYFTERKTEHLKKVPAESLVVHSVKGTTSILTHFRSPPSPPTLSAPKNNTCDLPNTSCQSHLVKFT